MLKHIKNKQSPCKFKPIKKFGFLYYKPDLHKNNIKTKTNKSQIHKQKRIIKASY